jgi:S1-C subfamily serine protease
MKRPGRIGSKANLRAYLGTIPDYSRTEVAAVTLSGIIKGGPADQAGVQRGDQIIELSDTKIQNIYDYTYAISALKIGVTVRVVLVRDGEQLTLQITPRSRE